MIFFRLLLLSLFIAGSALPPKKKATTKTTPVRVIFNAVVGDKKFYADSLYKTPSGEEFSIRSLKFFVSELALSSAAAVERKPAYASGENGIHLIDLSDSKSDTVSLNFPDGAYSDFRFNIGVPRDLNHRDPSSAPPPLDLGNSDMFWEWNSGYIFFLLDGKTEAIAEKMLHFAIGNDARVMPFWFGDLFKLEPLIKVNKEQTSTIFVTLDVLQLFKNGDQTNYSINTTERAIVHGGYNADVVRNNVLNAMKVEVKE